MNAFLKILEEKDVTKIAQDFAVQGWSKPESTFYTYLQEQKDHQRTVWAALYEGIFVGYVTLKWHSGYPPFNQQNIPEIADLNVVPAFRKKGIGSQLLDVAEQEAFKKGSVVGIGVGLHEGYGPAQKLYVKRGYIPDGLGITHEGRHVKSHEPVIANDDLILWFTKKSDSLSQLKYPQGVMSAEKVVELAKLLASHNIEFYIDGGWGVDALLGTQTRPHGDLDIALPHCYVPKLRELLGKQGYQQIFSVDQKQCAFVLSDEQGHKIDVHSYTLDADGNNIYGVPYQAKHLTGTGIINGHTIKCIPPAVMVEFHTGYPLDENDYHDVKALCEKFNIPLPKEYDKFK